MTPENCAGAIPNGENNSFHCGTRASLASMTTAVTSTVGQTSLELEAGVGKID